MLLIYFPSKGMRGVRRCHLLWSWEQEFEVWLFFSSLPFVCFPELCESPCSAFPSLGTPCDAPGSALTARDSTGCSVRVSWLPCLSSAAECWQCP